MTRGTAVSRHRRGCWKSCRPACRSLPEVSLGCQRDAHDPSRPRGLLRTSSTGPERGAQDSGGRRRGVPGGLRGFRAASAADRLSLQTQGGLTSGVAGRAPGAPKACLLPQEGGSEPALYLAPAHAPTLLEDRRGKVLAHVHVLVSLRYPSVPPALPSPIPVPCLESPSAHGAEGPSLHPQPSIPVGPGVGRGWAFLGRLSWLPLPARALAAAQGSP